MRRSCIVLAVATWACIMLIAADLSQADARKLKNPVPFSKKAIDQGRATFMQNCISCHGENGKAEGAMVPPPTDLTSPRRYKSGNSDGEIYRSIRDGAGDQMPPFKYMNMSDAEIWQLVSFVHSLWPEDLRPPLQDDKK